MANNNSGGYQPDLFGGQSKSYTDKDGNKTTMNQTEEQKLENERRGGTNDYPHSTLQEGKPGGWHTSNSGNSARVEETPVPKDEKTPEQPDAKEGDTNHNWLW